MDVRNRTVGLGLIGGVLVLGILGVGVWTRSNSDPDADKETIAIAERLLGERFRPMSWTFTTAKVGYDGSKRRTVRGLFALSMNGSEIASCRSPYEVRIESRRGEWKIRDFGRHTALWQRVVNYTKTLLP